MRKRIRLAAIAISALLVGARPARADTYVDTNAEMAVIGFGAVNLIFTGVDLTRLSQGKESPRVYAAVELATAASEITVFAIMSSDPRRSAANGIFALGITWAGALGIHGLVNLVQHGTASEPATAPVARTAWLDVAPTMVDAGRDRVAPGLVLAGRF